MVRAHVGKPEEGRRKRVGGWWAEADATAGSGVRGQHGQKVKDEPRDHIHESLHKEAEHRRLDAFEL